MRHSASARYWETFNALPAAIQDLARANFELIKRDPAHPSLHFKSVANGRFRSVRVGLHHRALGISVPQGVHWFWIGSHAEYDKLLS